MDYQSLYYQLFSTYDAVIRQLDQQNYGHARELLISAQQAAEEAYLKEEDEK